MSLKEICPQCGAPLPGNAVAWLCPKCLLSQASMPAEVVTDSNPVVLSRTLHRFGDYELLREIARGGMGAVYLARQISLNRAVAVKMLLFGKLAGDEFTKRFRAEAEAAASLQHPNIVAIHEVGEHEGQPFFSMDYVEGSDLAALVRENPLPPKRSACYLKTIAEAIHYAHERGILHRDLKPSNILIDAQQSPRITDFGLAKRLQSDLDLTVTGQVLGTPNYMPPEQASGKRRDISPASDVYSLGAILYHLLTGRPPFLGDTLEAALTQLLQNDPVPPRLLNPSVPRDLETICLKCLSKEPSHRYGSTLELAQDLSRWLNGEPIRARPITWAEMLMRWSLRRPAITALIIALIFVGAAGLAGILWQWHRAETNAGEAVAKLRESYLAQARANRLAGRPGQRFDTLAAITNAVALRPPSVQLAQLRNQAIAAMSLPDLVPLWTLENRDASWNGGSIDLAGSRYALVNTNGEVEVRRVPDNALLFELPKQPTPALVPYGFSPDGRYLAICNTNFRVAVWDLVQHRMVLKEPGSGVKIGNQLSGISESVAFSPDSKRVAIAAVRMNAVAVWDLVAGQRAHTVTNQRPFYIGFDPTGRRLAISSPQSSVVRIVDIETGAKLYDLDNSHRVSFPAWSPFHPVLAVGCSDGLVRFWELGTGRQIALGVAENGESGGAAFNHRGDLLVNATWTRLPLWRPAVSISTHMANADRPSLSPSFRGVGNGSQLQFSADDRRLSHTGWGMPMSKLEIDAISGAPEVRVFRSPRATFEFLRFALNDDGSVAALTLSNAVQLLDVETGVELARLPLPGAREPVFMPDYAGLVASSEQGVFTWSFPRRNEDAEVRIEAPRRIQTGEGWTHVRIGPQRRHVAMWHSDHAYVHSLPDFRPIARIGNHLGGAVLGPSFSADESLLTVSRWNNENIPIWSIVTSNLLHTIHLTYSRGITHGHAEFTPDGKWFVVTTMEDIRLYEPQSWNLHASIPWKSSANQQTFLAGGKVVAVVTDNTGIAVHLLTIPDFKELAVLETASNITIAHLGTSHDGLKLFAVREDGEVNVWNLPLIAASLQDLSLGWEPPLPSPTLRKPAAVPCFRTEMAETR